MADYIVSSGIVSSGLNVNTSGTQVNVLSGGTIISGSFMNPVKVNVLNGGVASSATLSVQAVMILSGGNAVDTVVSGALTELRVINGGFASY